MRFACGNEVKNASSITGAFGGNVSATHVTHGFGISEKRSGACASTSRKNGNHSWLVRLEQDGAPLVATRDRCMQPVVDKDNDDLRWHDILEELLAMLLVALAVFLLSA